MSIVQLAESKVPATNQHPRTASALSEPGPAAEQSQASSVLQKSNIQFLKISKKIVTEHQSQGIFLPSIIDFPELNRREPKDQKQQDVEPTVVPPCQPPLNENRKPKSPTYPSSPKSQENC
ncbi:hypothetical protein ILYODFUR_035725 [Ilyodon furcidens]|uniref:Uncharacterized protein n=1 Tax=Ilyodon furcidens TaxID=33524 RepID=A0ABV0TDX2_9TELE